MLQAVKLPKGEDVNEWLAVNSPTNRQPLSLPLSLHAWRCSRTSTEAHAILLCVRAATDFFNEISMLYGTISEYCTKASCPVMAAGDCRYLWADKKITKPIECSAPEYVDNLMNWVESQLNDETIFPIKFDSSYPKKFHAICSTIYKRFFRVYAHIYHARTETHIHTRASERERGREDAGMCITSAVPSPCCAHHTVFSRLSACLSVCVYVCRLQTDSNPGSRCASEYVLQTFHVSHCAPSERASEKKKHIRAEPSRAEPRTLSF